MYPNLVEASLSININKMAPRKKNNSSAREKLTAVNPSGKKDNSFFELVFDVTRQIPKGRVTSYGAIAACLGTKLSARMVGWAMHAAGSAKPKVPAHRVVNRNGMLSGKHHFNPPSKMEDLLKKEGIKVKNDIIIDFKNLFWDPATELI
jgi:methylated-DNA-protein-cysteine methyltransferase-like protein